MRLHSPFTTSVRALCVATLVPWLLLLAGCPSRESVADKGAKDGILYRGSGTEPESLDPHTVRGVTEWTIVGSLFEGLVVADPEKPGVKPGVAESWTVSKDQRVYTFHLRAGAKWSDGRPVTADDFYYSMRRLLTPALGSAHAEDTLFFIQGARDYQNGRLTDFSQVGIRVVDAAALEVTLETPTPFFTGALIQVYPVRQDVVEKFGKLSERGSKWTLPENFVGNGAFVLKRWEPNKEIVVAKSGTYWDATSVRLNEVHFLPYENPVTEEAAFRNGLLHMTNQVPVSKLETYAKEHPELLHSWADYGNYFYSVNVKKAPFNDPRVRRALSLAVDREVLAKRLQGGRQAATSFCPPGLGGYEAPNGLVRYDVAEAKRLLAEAGFPDGKDFPGVEILIDGREPHRMVAETVQHMWKTALGIPVRLRNEETRALIASKNVFDFTLVRGSWNASTYQDPHYFVSSWVTGGLYNEAGWSDPKFDALVTKAKTTVDVKERYEAFREAEAEMLREMPVIPLFFSAQTVLASPKIKGWSGIPYSDRLFKTMWLDPAAP